MCVMGRLAECEEPVLFARFGEVDKCEFIKMNAPMDAWAFTDDGTGLLVKTGGLREQAREVLAREVPYSLYITSHSNGLVGCLSIPQEESLCMHDLWDMAISKQDIDVRCSSLIRVSMCCGCIVRAPIIQVRHQKRLAI